MLYSLVEMNRAAMAPMRLFAKGTMHALQQPLNPLRDTAFGRSALAASSVFERATRYYGKPDWQISQTRIDGRAYPVKPVAVWSTPWCKLIQSAPSSDMRAIVRTFCNSVTGHSRSLPAQS